MNPNSLISNERYSQLMEMAQIGWWKADFSRNTLVCSDFIHNMFDVSSKEPFFGEYLALIREDYRESISRSFLFIPQHEYKEYTFPMHTKCGCMWFRAGLGVKEKNEYGQMVVWGYIQCVEAPSEDDRNKQQQQRLNRLLAQQNSISHSLLSLSKAENITGVINQILNEILVQFNAGRTYIFEFDFKNQWQSCTYEALNEGITSEIKKLQEMSMNCFSWWSEHIISGQSIVMCSLDELPSQAIREREVLSAQSIKSIMAVPLLANDQVCGYMGVDIVNEYRKWSLEDYQWFSSLANIISICIEQYNSRKQALIDKQNIDNLYQHMPVAYLRYKFLLDSEGNVDDFLLIDVNCAFETITGISRDGFLGHTVRELGLFDQEQMELVNKLLHSGKHVEADSQLKNGKYIHHILYMPQPGEMVSLFTDTTDSILAHEALDHSEQILRNIYTNIPVGIELYDKDGYLLDLNNKDMEIFGVAHKEDAIGLNIFDNPNIPAFVCEALARREPVDFRFAYSFRVARDYYLPQKTGSLDLLCKATVLYDSKGNPANYVFINIDNTETSNAYNKIEEFESMFSLIADFAKVGFLRWNPLTKEGFAIEQWFKNYETDSRRVEDVAGSYPTLHPEDRMAQSLAYGELLEGKRQNFSRELRVIRSDGSVKWIRSTVLVKKYEPRNNIIELIGVNFDITELKNAETMLIAAKERAEESDKLKSAFLANMSHEIRTPLNAIVGFSNLLVNTQEEEERKQYISIVEENNELLLKLISDILDLAKIEAGTFEVVNGDVDVNQLCSDIVKSVRLKASSKVEVLFENYLPECHVISDKNRLRQVIANFANNALKFTSQGCISIGYYVRDDEMEFYVRDTGLGIAPEMQSLIFDRFVKLNSFVHGTGLGLSICQSIVKQMGGRIGVDSECGKGARFWFTYPLYKENIAVRTGQAYESAEQYPESEALARVDRKPVILVAEDTDSNYLLVNTILKGQYIIYRAVDGHEAVKMHEEIHPDLILMDIRMPNKDGIEATKEIREKDLKTPIIALTAFAYNQDRQKTMEAGCDGFITKPLSAVALKKTIENSLNRG